MRSDLIHRITARLSVGWLVLIIALSWLVVISGLHYWVNFSHAERERVLMGYMPVITNLACPLLDYATKDGTGVRYEALKFSSFAEMGEALRQGKIEAAFIIAPLSVALHQQGAGVRIVYIGNRHESTLVYRKDLTIKDFRDLAGKSVAVPLRYSGHNLCMRQLAETSGMRGADLNIVEMNPPDMASALATGALDAYFVGEPFAAQTIRVGDSKALYYVEQVWPNFICNLLLMRQDYIDRKPDRVQALVQAAARSGLWAKANPQEAARIACAYWNQPRELVEYALQTPPGRIVYDRFIPQEHEIQRMADLMVKFGLIRHNDISGLVDARFADNANLEGITDFKSILKPVGAGK